MMSKFEKSFIQKLFDQIQHQPMLSQLVEIFLIAGILIGIISGQQLRNHETAFLLKQTEQNYTQVLNILGNSAKDSIISEDVSLLKTLVEDVGVRDHNIAHIAIFDNEKELLTEWRTNRLSKESNFQPPAHIITINNRYQGEIRIAIDVEPALLEIQQHVYSIQLLLFALLLILLVVIGYLMVQIAIRPVKNIEERLRQIGEGDFQSNFQTSGSNEIQNLVESINDVATSLQQQNLVELHHKMALKELNNAYVRFVPNNFLEYLHRDSIIQVELGDHVAQNMTILFSDIRDFTPFAESLTANETFEFINQYLKHLGPLIRMHNGFIDKYIGDAIMALFENPVDAIYAALHTLDKLDEFIAQNSNYPPIKIGLGIHTGPLILGTIGETFRMESTVIGDAVNLASRLESLTKQYKLPLLVSEETVLHIKDHQTLQYRFIDTILAKGKSIPTTIYEVFSMTSSAMNQAKHHNYALYRAYIDNPITDVENLEWNHLDPMSTVYQSHLQRQKRPLKFISDTDFQ